MNFRQFRMTRCFACWLIFGLTLALATSPAGAVTHDLRSDFISGPPNPNSTSGWGFHDGTGAALTEWMDGFTPLPNPPYTVDWISWNEPDIGPGQAGWAGAPATPWAGFAAINQINADITGWDLTGGDIITHGTSEVIFTPTASDPASGSFSITGGVNNIRQLGRAGAWQLYRNDQLLTFGQINDTFTSANPSLFADGVGGITNITSINYGPGDVIRLLVTESDFVNLNFGINTSAAPGHEPEDFPVPETPLGYYRFEEASGTDIIDTFSGLKHGEFVGFNGTDPRSTDVPWSTVPLTGEANTQSANFTEVGHALIETSAFIFNSPQGGGARQDATVEWMMKVPNDTIVNQGHSSVFWTNAIPGDSDRFNIFWDASFTGAADSDRFVSGDFRAPGAAGPHDIGGNGHNNANPLTEDEWHHVAIVRTDNTPGDDSDFDYTWEWYIDGLLSDSHTATTTSETPVVNFGWLIAARDANPSTRMLFDEMRMTEAALSPDMFLIGTGGTQFEADFDEDGDVDGDDFLLWQVGFGAMITSGATKMDGDWDNDGDVDGDDFLGWQAEFPSPASGDGSGAVPEPSTFGLLSVVVIAFLGGRRRGRA